MTLSKSDKKVARILIDKGLEIERSELLQKAGQIVAAWQGKEKDSQSAYMELYAAVCDADKAIARRYDGLGGSAYFDTVLGLLWEGKISEEDIQAFSQETQSAIATVKAIRAKYLENNTR